MICRWLLAWFASALVWLWLVDTPALPEMLAGVVAAAIAATGFELVRRQRISRARAYPPAVSALPRQLLRVTADLALLTRGVWWALLRKRNHAGTFHSIPFTAREPATDDSRRAAVE